MKTNLNKLILILIFMIIAGYLRAGDEYSRVIKKEYDVNADPRLIISNKYGKIHCNNWENNKIQIEVTITVTASSTVEADRIMDGISVVFSGDSSLVEAKTIMNDIKTRGRTYFQIDYMVNMPLATNLDLTNKFGNVYINEVSGKCKVNLAYGNLDAKKLGNGDNLLDLKFAEGDVNWMKGAVLMLKYSSFNLDYAGSLRLDSKFSNLRANKIVALNASTEGGQIDMESTAALDCKTKFSDIDVERLEQSLNLDIQYGSFDVFEVAQDFSSISVRNKYGDISIELPENAKYQLEAQLKFCDLNFPVEKGKFSLRSTSPTEKAYKGIINGEGETPASKVKVTSEFGNVSLR